MRKRWPEGLERLEPEENRKIERAASEDPDTWEATEEELATARVGLPFGQDTGKVLLTFRLEADVASRLMGLGTGWKEDFLDCLVAWLEGQEKKAEKAD